MDLALAIVLYNALKDKIYGVTPPITNGNGVTDYQIGDYCPTAGKRLASGQICVNNVIQPQLPYAEPKLPNGGNGPVSNGNGNGPDIVGPEPVEFDITTLPEFAGQVAPDGICPMHYTNVQVSGPYHVCKRSDLV